MTQGPDRTRLRMTFMGMTILSLISALVVRLWFLQILSGADLADAAESNRVKYVSIEPPRGDILDRNGAVLVANRLSRVVAIQPEELPSVKHERLAVLSRLGEVLGMSGEQIEARLADKTVSPFSPIPIKEDVPKDSVIYIREHQDLFPGVQYLELPVRIYPQGTLAAHLLGYVGEINSDQLKEPYYGSYQAGALIGRSGIEAAYEHELHGRSGKVKLEVNSRGKVLGTLGRLDPVSGESLVTTIDVRIQKITEESLAQGIEKVRGVYDKGSGKRYLAPAGGAIVLDPNNGEIISMASYPGFDPSAFIGGISREGFAALANDPAHPLINRVTQAAFPPGSTFKVITAAAALQDGVASSGGRYNCPASYRFRDRTFRNWRNTDSGTISVTQAIIDSCDTVFYPWGAEFYRRFVSGAGERLQDYARAFGLGAHSGIEIGDKAGRVPDEAWLKQQHKDHPRLFPNNVWLPGYTINMSIGQGDVLTTPLQMASVYGSIANGGVLYKPHVGLRLMRGDKATQTISSSVIRKLPVGAGAMATVKAGLQGVPTIGTARGAFAGFPLDRVPVAAKTGTAELQTIPPQQPYAWFAAYAPAHAPSYVVVVMLEQGGHGGEAAAPIARRILEGLFNLGLSDISPAARTD